MTGNVISPYRFQMPVSATSGGDLDPPRVDPAREERNIQRRFQSKRGSLRGLVQPPPISHLHVTQVYVELASPGFIGSRHDRPHHAEDEPLLGQSLVPLRIFVEAAEAAPTDDWRMGSTGEEGRRSLDDARALAVGDGETGRLRAGITRFNGGYPRWLPVAVFSVRTFRLNVKSPRGAAEACNLAWLQQYFEPSIRS